MTVLGDIPANDTPDGSSIDVGILGNWFPIAERHARLKTSDSGQQVLAFNGEDSDVVGGTAPSNAGFWVSPTGAAVPGRTAKARIVTAYHLNNISTSVSVTMGLHRLSSVAYDGTITALGGRVGAAIKSMSGLAASHSHVHLGPEFNLDDAAVALSVLVATLSAAMPADARIRLESQLQYRWA